MIDFVPIQFYKVFYYNFMLFMVFVVWLSSNRSKLTNSKSLNSKSVLGVFILLIITVYIGLRPVSAYRFGDMGVYAASFQNYADGYPLILSREIAFDYFMYQCAQIMTVNFFFLVCALIYIVPLYLASKRLFKEYWFYSFFILVCSFMFWSFGTNGIRNGIATSIMLLALAYSDRKSIMIVLMILAVNFHKSMLLPIGAYIITLFFKDSKKLFYFWLLCIPLSLAAGGSFEALFAGLGFDDDRLKYFSDENINDQVINTGFRWDFLLYSALASYAGWYFVFKKNFKDPLYNQLLNVYLICNGFWILVIRANFSNRFAYLSWFMMGLVIIYPLLKKEFFRKQHQVIGTIILGYFAFTYLLEVILYQN